MAHENYSRYQKFVEKEQMDYNSSGKFAIDIALA